MAHKNKKGFTLIELLAVIVILGIIALIATPRILNVISVAKANAAKDSAYGYIKAVEYKNSESILDDKKRIPDGTYEVYELKDIALKGSKPLYGEVTIKKSAVEEAHLCIDGFIVDYIDGVATPNGECNSNTEGNETTILITNEKATTNSFEIEFVASDSIGIKEINCYYSEDTEYKTKGTISGNKCIASGLNNNKDYNYKIEVLNKLGTVTEQTGTIKTINFETITITTDPADWGSSKTVTITGKNELNTLYYQVGESVDETKWVEYKNPFTITKNTNIYAKLTDGTNTSDTKVFAETKIDTTEPVVTIGNVTSTTNTITIPFGTSDEESNIKETTCVYGTSTNYGNTGTLNSDKTVCTLSNLTSGTTYYYKITTTNNAGKSTSKESSYKAGDINQPITISSIPTDWATSKTVTITGTASGAKLQYQVGESVDENKWMEYTDSFTITSNTNIYARLYDGKNASNTKTFAEGKIDTTAPELAIGTLTNVTNKITIPITTNKDSQSDIKTTTCVYGISTSYGSTGTISGNVCTLSNLTSGTTYYYKITTTNNAGLITDVKGSTATGNINQPITITTNTTNWATSKTVTITGTASGAKLQYQTGTSIVEANWKDYTGSFTITSNTNIYARLFDGKNASDTKTYAEAKIDTTEPVVAIGNVTSTTNKITIPFGASDEESDIKTTTCVYGTSTSYGTTGTLNSDNTTCTLSNLTSGQTYYYKITTTNNAGLTTTKESSYKVGDINQPITITTNKTDWAASKTVTITGTASGARLQYQIGSSVVEANWKDYTSSFTITSNTNIYARLYDGKNASNTKTYTEAKIDTTAPTLTIGNISNTTNLIIIPIEAIDEESNIKTTTCVYGTSTSYGSTGTISNNNCTISGLTSGQTYYYKITTTNNAGLTTTKESSYKTIDINQTISITTNKTDWSTSKNVTITGTASGARLQYQTGTSVVEANWKDYTSSFTITSNTNIYARLYDGKNASNTKTYAEAKIDTTAPELAIGTLTSTTNKITIPITKNQDLQSNIKSTICVYGTSTSYGSTGTISGSTCTLSNLTSGITYYYKITTTNNAGLSTEVKGSNASGNINQPITITTDKTDWATSKNVTITGTASGARLQYQTGTSVVEANWKDYTGSFTINSNTNIYARLYDGKNASDTKTYNEAKIDTTVPVLSIGNVTSTTKTITIPFGASDEESNIKTTTCVYGTSTSYGSTGTLNSDKTVCTLNNLTSGTTYYYKITTTNNAGLSTTKESSYKAGDINQVITISANPTSWATSKNVTITGTASGARLQYQTGTSVVEANWKDYTSAFTITSNTNIYARLYDGKNASNTKTYAEAKIDTTKPELTLGTVTTSTSRMIIPITTNKDSQSNIKTTTCVYGISTSYGSTGTISNNNCTISGLTSGQTYYYKITTTNNAGLTTEVKGSKTLGTTSITFSLNPSDNSSAISVTVTPTFTTTNVTTKTYYIKSTVATTVSENVYACGNSTNPGTCSSTATISMNANYWYKTSSTKPVITLTNNGNIYALIHDGDNYLTSKSITIANIVTSASEIYYNNSTYTKGQDITVQQALEELYGLYE